MKIHFRIACYNLSGAVALFLTACAPSATSKPDSGAGTDGASAARNPGADSKPVKDSVAAPKSLMRLLPV